MAMDYCGEASLFIKVVQERVSGHRVQLHQRQCHYLSSKMSDTGSFLSEKSNCLVGITSSDDIRQKALQQLHFTVKRAETLVRDCCCEVEPSWLESAVTLPQIKEDIVHILLDLRWWTSMVDIAIASVTWVKSGGHPIEQELLKEAEMGIQTLLQEFKSLDNELEEAFVLDREQLLRRVQKVLSSYYGKPRDLDYLLATHVRTRLENTDLVQSMVDVELNIIDIVDFIGAGSYGTVMNVQWLGRSCALKVLNNKCAKEAMSLSAFHHPHIVQFFRYWEAPSSNESPLFGSPVGSSTTIPSDAASPEPEYFSTSHVLMERLPTNLAQHLRKSKLRAESKWNLSTSKVAPLSQDVAIDAMLQVTKAMSHLNDNNVAHRNLKPSNVLLMPVSKEFPELAECGYVRVKLGGFGLAASYATSALAEKVGTRLYGAPEIFTNESIAEKGKVFPGKADVWGFGIMFSEVLSGQTPFMRDGDFSLNQLKVKIQKGLRPSLPATCPDYLKFIITNCWQLRPQDRPNFTDLWKLLRIAQVRSLGLIQADYDFFTYTTREGIEKRLHKLPVPVIDQVYGCFPLRVPFAKSKVLGPSPSYITKPFNDSKHQDNLPQTPFADLTVDCSVKTQAQALDQMEMGEEKYPKWKLEKSERILRLQRAWVVHSAWASIENVCKISSGILVNKLQCEHIANHFKVIADVLKKLGLGEDFVSSEALEGGSSIQTNLTFDEERFSHIAETFQEHVFSLAKINFYANDNEIFSLKTQIQDMSSMFEDYIRELPTLDGSSEKSLSKQSKIHEDFQDFRLQGMSTRENVEAQSRNHKQCRLDEFLGLLFVILKQGEDLVLFHSGLERADNGVVERTGPYGEKFIHIHELLYRVLDSYACLELCEGTRFAQGYLFECYLWTAQSSLCYLNSNCLSSVLIDDSFLNIELVTILSELLERPNCILKTLFIKGSFGVKVDQVELQMLQKYHLMVIAALSKCVSITSLTASHLNGEEVHELCKNLSNNKVLENLVVLIHRPLTDDNAMDICAMLKGNHCLKSLTLLFDNINPKGAAYLGAMLIENSSLEELIIQFVNLDKSGMKDLMRPLMTDIDEEPQVNLSLKHLRIGIGECLSGVAEIIAQLLRTNKTLTHFSIFSLNLDPDGTCEIFDSLKKNRTLQVLDLHGQLSLYNSSEVVTCLEAVLTENSTLEELKVDMRMWDNLCLKHLLRPLMANEDGEPCVNKSLRRLHLLNYHGDQDWEVVESIAQMLRTNERLEHFSMINAYFNTFVVCKILDSLKKNKALQILNLDECKGLEDPQVKVAFIDLLVNYNFTLSTIRIHGRDWDIEAFMKYELELDTEIDKGRLCSLISGSSKSSTVRSAYELNQVVAPLNPSYMKALEDFKLEKGEESTLEKHGSFMKAFEEYQEELLVGCPNKPKEISGLKCKLEMESEQSLQEMKPLLESISKSSNFLLQRNLNMAQFLQKKYIEWNSFVEMYPSKLTNEEKDEFSKGCIVAALFPTTFLYHLKAHFLEVPNVGGILHTLKEVAGLVVQRMKSLQNCGSETFQFIDYVDIRAPLDVQHIYSSVEAIAMCQIFSTKIGIREELLEENSVQYGIVQDHLTGAYYFESGKSSNLDKPNLEKPLGVIGVKVTSTDIQVEIIWEDGSYYSGPLEDFSYELELDNNKQCALEAFGDLKGAHFLRSCGLKCSPLLVIALAMTIHRKGLGLTWSNGKGHIESNSLLHSLQPMELEVWEGQIVFGGDINQLGDAVEWGMNELNPDCASSSGGNLYQDILKQDPNQTFPNFEDESPDSWSSDDSYDISNHTPNNIDLVALATQRNALATQINAGAQDKVKVSGGLKVLGSGGEGGGEIKNSKGKIVQGQAYEKIQDLHWKDMGGYAIVRNLNDEHQSLAERLFLGFLCTLDFNYLVVYDDYKESHVSIYCVMERNHEARLELKWITDIFIKGGLERIKKIFQGLKGETLEVTRKYTEFNENPLQQQSKRYIKWFKNRLSNNGSCKDDALQMVSIIEGHHPMISNDEWEHIVGRQPYPRNKFWWAASYMKAITYSRTIYSSGILLSTHTTEKNGLNCGRARRRKLRCDASNYVHDTEDVKSFAKFSKAPKSLSIKWHGSIYWGGFR